MKELRITLDDADFKKLVKKKGDRTWREFLLEGC
jgi:hypothetical protein